MDSRDTVGREKERGVPVEVMSNWNSYDLYRDGTR